MVLGRTSVPGEEIHRGRGEQGWRQGLGGEDGGGVGVVLKRVESVEEHVLVHFVLGSDGLLQEVACLC